MRRKGKEKGRGEPTNKANQRKRELGKKKGENERTMHGGRERERELQRIDPKREASSLHSGDLYS